MRRSTPPDTYPCEDLFQMKEMSPDLPALVALQFELHLGHGSGIPGLKNRLVENVNDGNALGVYMPFLTDLHPQIHGVRPGAGKLLV